MPGRVGRRGPGALDNGFEEILGLAGVGGHVDGCRLAEPLVSHLGGWWGAPVGPLVGRGEDGAFGSGSEHSRGRHYFASEDDRRYG